MNLSRQYIITLLMVDVVVRVGPIRTPQDLLFIRHAQVTAQKVISGFIKGFIENNHQLTLRA